MATQHFCKYLKKRERRNLGKEKSGGSQLFLHFAPISQYGRIRKNGIRKTPGKGVFAVPLLHGIPRSELTLWKRTLEHERGVKLLPVLFRIPGNEAVYAFEDFVERIYNFPKHASYARMPATASARLGKSIAEKNAAPLPREYVAHVTELFGGMKSHELPRYSFEHMEVVIPRSIKKKEVLRAIRLGSASRDKKYKEQLDRTKQP